MTIYVYIKGQYLGTVRDCTVADALRAYPYSTVYEIPGATFASIDIWAPPPRRA